VLLDDRFRDREAEPRAAALTIIGAVELLEPAK
jgi:hypothetical protein